ncbi:type I methionyl aminopeptidase [Pontibacillus litoralis]|uniref:Methionine aminopeptidase n=1 Tax=Pontibacillus litoralis JSM 072002 TaxID=1385512 RepID=A0A0A5G0Z1_9BACI|nr:type I methionyl aminopeptidase [Pontibacillus litoralis]KGX84778.1 methionine aminopeptidase [Pontibacillus litoralis JSM 072002]
MIVRTDTDMENIQNTGKMLATIRDEMIRQTIPGISTKELDQIAGRMFREAGGISAPKQDFQFPGYTCISVNEEVAHGIPGNRIIQEGDLVNIDVSGSYNGYYADTGLSFLVGAGNKKIEKLLNATEKVFAKGLSQFKTDSKLSDVGRATETAAKQEGYFIIKELTGHGVGHSLRDKPEHVFSYYTPWDDEVLKEGAVIAFEPFVSIMEDNVHQKMDGWTLATNMTGNYVAQIEHTIIVTNDTPIICTL